MVRKKKPQKPGWKDVEVIIGEFDRDQLIYIIHDLYQLSIDNQDFFFARFSVGEDLLAPYKKIIQNSIHPYLEDGEPLNVEEANDRWNLFGHRFHCSGVARKVLSWHN